MAESDELTGISGVAADVMEALGEVGVGVLVAAENLFPPVPSEVVLPLAGFLAAQGRLSVVLTIVAATVGSLVGALALYELGARVGSPRLHWLVDRMPLLEEEDLEKAEDWFRRHGEASVLIGRCIPVVRSLISIPAGVERMPRWRFLLLTTLGSGVWNTFFVVAGYALGAQFEQVGQYSSYLNYAIYAAIIVLLALALRRGLMRRRTA